MGPIGASLFFAMIEPSQLFSPLYKQTVVSELSADGIECFSIIWTVPENLPYVDGHFPGMPVFPAVGILDVSLVVLQCSAQNKKLRLKSVDSAKYLNLVTPGLQVRLDWKQLDIGQWQVDWKSEDLAKSYATLVLSVA